MKLTTMISTTEKGETLKIEGRIVRLYVGAYQHKFLIHKSATGFPYLSHFASGGRIGPLKIASHENCRKLAIGLIDRLISIKGVDAVNDVLNKAPVLN